MSRSIGYDKHWKRDIGYSVPAFCDHPGCLAEIDRGLSHVCGGEPCGGDVGCGLYFCSDHLTAIGQLCERCHPHPQRKPFKPTPDHPKWTRFKLTDKSWDRWRKSLPAAELAALQKADDMNR